MADESTLDPEVTNTVAIVVHTVLIIWALVVAARISSTAHSIALLRLRHEPKPHSKRSKKRKPETTLVLTDHDEAMRSTLRELTMPESGRLDVPTIRVPVSFGRVAGIPLKPGPRAPRQVALSCDGCARVIAFAEGGGLNGCVLSGRALYFVSLDDLDGFINLNLTLPQTAPAAAAPGSGRLSRRPSLHGCGDMMSPARDARVVRLPDSDDEEMHDFPPSLGSPMANSSNHVSGPFAAAALQLTGSGYFGNADSGSRCGGSGQFESGGSNEFVGGIVMDVEWLPPDSPACSDAAVRRSLPMQLLSFELTRDHVEQMALIDADSSAVGATAANADRDAVLPMAWIVRCMASATLSVTQASEAEVVTFIYVCSFVGSTVPDSDSGATTDRAATTPAPGDLAANDDRAGLSAESLAMDAVLADTVSPQSVPPPRTPSPDVFSALSEDLGTPARSRRTESFGAPPSVDETALNSGAPSVSESFAGAPGRHAHTRSTSLDPAASCEAPNPRRAITPEAARVQTPQATVDGDLAAAANPRDEREPAGEEREAQLATVDVAPWLYAVVFRGRMFRVKPLYSSHQSEMTPQSTASRQASVTFNLPRGDSATDSDTDATTMSDPDTARCIVCYSRRANVILIPCGHVSVCGQCVMRLSSCPECRTDVGGVIVTGRGV